MSALALQWGLPVRNSQFVSASASPVGRSLSDFANKVVWEGRSHANDWRTTAINFVQQLAQEAARPNWDGEGAKPISANSRNAASVFLELLPFRLMEPDVAADPDDSFSFVWDRGRGHVLNVQVGRDYHLYFASISPISGRNRGSTSIGSYLPSTLLAVLEEFGR